MSTTVCAVTSGKGGVGKSTVAFYLANILAGGKSRSIILDFSVGIRGLDIFFRSEREVVYDLGDVLEGNCTGYHQALMSCKYNRNLYGIAAPSNPFFRFNFDPLYNLVNTLKMDFNYIFLDSPSSLGFGFVSAISLCDRAIVVTTPDPLSVAASSKIGIYIRNADTPMGEVVINGVNFRAKRPPIISNFDTIIDDVGFPLLGVIPYQEKVYDTMLKNRMVEKGTAFSKAVYNMARRYNREDVPLLYG